MNFEKKYLKYKEKYINLKKKLIGAKFGPIEPERPVRQDAPIKPVEPIEPVRPELVGPVRPEGPVVPEGPEGPVVPVRQVVGQVEPSHHTNKILFMFLGGFPTSNHWKKFFENADDSLYAVIHPMNVEQTKKIINDIPIYKKMVTNNRLFIVDEKNHVRTAWATFSLIAATLFMIQDALSKHGNIFKKFVLLDSTNAPLYNYNVIKNTLCIDDKSWFYFSKDNHGYARNQFKKMYDFEGGIFTLNDNVYISQWFTIDQKHVGFYIDLDIPNFITYEKKENIKCDKLTDILKSISPKTEYQEYIIAHIGTQRDYSYEEAKDIVNSGFCITADESFFGVIFKHNIKRKFRNNVKHKKIDELNSNNSRELISPVGNEDYYLLENQTVVLCRSQEDQGKYTNSFRTWYGSSPLFNEYNLKYQIRTIKNSNPAEDGSDKYFLFKNNKIYKISEKQKKLLENEIEYDNLQNGEPINKLRGGVSDKNDNNNDYINIVSSEYLTESYCEIYTISTTYTDWSINNLNPDNLFRDFDSSYFHPEGRNKKYFEKIIDELKKEPIIFINELNNNPLPINLDWSNYYSFTKHSEYHPVDYTTFNLNSVLNSYNIILYFSLNDDNHIKDFHIREQFSLGMSIYKNLIYKNIENIDTLEINNKVYYVFKSNTTDDIKNKIYGHPVTSFSLNNALHYGALFMRKVTDSGQIDKYTDQLFKLPAYRYHMLNVNDYPERDPKYKYFDSILYDYKKIKN